MKMNPKRYGDLTPAERVRALLAAQARRDDVECDLLMASAPRCSCGCVAHEVMVPLRRVMVAGGAAIAALSGPVETIEAFALMLAPATPWPDFLDPDEFPRPTTMAREIERGCDTATRGQALFGLDLPDETMGLLDEYGRHLRDSAAQRAEEVAAWFLVFAHQRVTTALAGITDWCDAVGLDPEAFLGDWCGGTLDRLSAVRPAVEHAARIVSQEQARLEETLNLIRRFRPDDQPEDDGQGQFPNGDPDYVDEISALDLTNLLLDRVPSLDPAVSEPRW